MPTSPRGYAEDNALEILSMGDLRIAFQKLCDLCVSLDNQRFRFRRCGYQIFPAGKAAEHPVVDLRGIMGVVLVVIQVGYKVRILKIENPDIFAFQ